MALLMGANIGVGFAATSSYVDDVFASMERNVEMPNVADNDLLGKVVCALLEEDQALLKSIAIEDGIAKSNRTAEAVRAAKKAKRADQFDNEWGVPNRSGVQPIMNTRRLGRCSAGFDD